MTKVNPFLFHVSHCLFVESISKKVSTRIHREKQSDNPGTQTEYLIKGRHLYTKVWI